MGWRAALCPTSLFSSGDAGRSRPAQTRPPRPVGRATPWWRQPRTWLPEVTGARWPAGRRRRAQLGGQRTEELPCKGWRFPYWRAIATWYETVSPRRGGRGRSIASVIRDTLDGAGVIGPSAQPPATSRISTSGSTSRSRPGPPIRSSRGWCFQCDIIPDTWEPAGWAANCEDTVAIADEALRSELATRHPGVAARIESRRRVMIEQLGLEIGDEILPLSCIAAYFPPFWLSPDKALVLER